MVTPLASIEASEAHHESASELVAKIRGILPPGWTASYDQEQSRLFVERTEELMMFSVLPNSSSDEEASLRGVLYIFSVTPLVTPAQYKAQKRRNDEIRKELVRMAAPFRGVLHTESGKPYARNDEERAFAVEYEALKAQLHSLPDYYFMNASLTAPVMDAWRFPHTGIVDEEPRRNAERVHKSVVRLFSRYVAE